MDFVIVEKIGDLVTAVIKSEITGQDTVAQRADALRDLQEMGITQTFCELLIDFAENIATGLSAELEEI